MSRVQIVGVHRQERLGGCDYVIQLALIHVDEEQLLVDPGDGSRVGILGQELFKQRQLTRLRRFLLDPLQQNAVLSFRIDIGFVPVRSQSSASEQQGKRENRDLHEV